MPTARSKVTWKADSLRKGKFRPADLLSSLLRLWSIVSELRPKERSEAAWRREKIGKRALLY